MNNKRCGREGGSNSKHNTLSFFKTARDELCRLCLLEEGIVVQFGALNAVYLHSLVVCENHISTAVAELNHTGERK